MEKGIKREERMRVKWDGRKKLYFSTLTSAVL